MSTAVKRTKLIAKDYEILRDVKASCLVKIPLARKPVRLGTLMDEALFIGLGGEIIHDKTIFIDDRNHDWDWDNGFLRYFSHAVGVGDIVDIVVIYELSKLE